MAKKIEFTESSGNVFADLGLPDAGEVQHKARLGALIHQSIREQGLSQVQAARVLGVNQPKISALMNGKMDGFSLLIVEHKNGAYALGKQKAVKIF